jgi:hypothetical protein
MTTDQRLAKLEKELRYTRIAGVVAVMLLACSCKDAREEGGQRTRVKARRSEVAADSEKAGENASASNRIVRLREAAAIMALQQISAGQAQAQAGAVIDVDEDGVGEFGYLGELSGRQSLIGSRLGEIRDGAALVLGYHVRVFLPDAEGNGVAESSNGGCDPKNPPNPENCEKRWCAYAWPEGNGGPRGRVFFVNEEDEILASDNTGDGQGYGGLSKAPRGNAAYVIEGGDGGSKKAARNCRGSDGGFWRPVDD